MLRFNQLEFMPVGETQVTVRRGIRSFDSDIGITNMHYKHFAAAERVDVQYLAFKDVSNSHLDLRHIQSLSVDEYRAFIFEIYPKLEGNEIVTLLHFKIDKFY